MEIFNSRQRPLTLCWWGTVADQRDPSKCWPLAPGGDRWEFETFQEHLHTVSDDTGFWMLFAPLPGKTLFYAMPDDGGGIMWDTVFTPAVVLRNLHSLSSPSMWYVRFLSAHRSSGQLVVFAACVAAAVKRHQSHCAGRKLLSGGAGASSQATTHDALKALALGPMILNHVGRFLFGSTTNTWWYCLSQYLSMPVYFFLTGCGASRQPPVLRTLLCFAFIRGAFNPLHTMGSTVLLMHSLVSLAFGAAPRLAAHPFRAHCVYAAACIALTPLLMDGLWLDGGAGAPLYAGAGAVIAGGGGRAAAAAWLAAATVSRTSTLIRQEYLPHAQAVGANGAADWGLVTAPLAVALVTLPAQLWLFWSHRRAPLPAAVPDIVSSALRWAGRHSLGIYVAHVAAFDLLSRPLGLKKDSDYNEIW